MQFFLRCSRQIAPMLLAGFSGSSIASGPDLDGWTLDLSPTQIKAQIAQNNPSLKWAAPYPNTMSGNGNVIYFSNLISPTTSPDFSFKNDLGNRVIEVRIAQKTRSELPLVDLLSDAFKKYGKPFQNSYRKYDFQESLILSWAWSRKERQIVDPETAEAACKNEYVSYEIKEPCGWLIKVHAVRKANSDTVEIISWLSSPVLTQAAYKRAFEGKVRF